MLERERLFAKMMNGKESFSQQRESSTQERKVHIRTQFDVPPGFCDCGEMISKTTKGPIICHICKKEWTVEVFGDMKSTISHKFPNRDMYKLIVENKVPSKSENIWDDCPKLPRECPKCCNNEMAYNILDSLEEEVVLYMCLKCRYTEKQEL